MINHGGEGLAFTGCLILGLGIGMLFDHNTEGLLIGLGIGFIVMAFLSKNPI